jgi:uncharacterized OB-fold protein/acyl dehydratase
VSSDDLLDKLRAKVGQSGPPQVARHPVSTPAVADWCDAIGDGNPCYLDEEYAAKSVHGGLVAPPATLDIWDRAGLPAQWRTAAGGDPRGSVLRELEAAGFVGVVAVNSELEIVRYLRPGDMVQHVQSLESVSERKQTGLGTGYFVTTRQRYTTTDGEHVGDLLFRILKFIPGTGKPPAAAGEGGPSLPPDPSPNLRPRPAINRDNQVLFDGYRKRELRVPKCGSCGRVFFPPSPRCAACGGFEASYAVADGRATLYSFTVVHHPKVPGFRYPLAVGVVELTDPSLPNPVRMLGDIVGVSPEQLRVGMPLELEWIDSHPATVEGATDSRGSITIPQWRPAFPPRRSETLTAAEVAEGDRLPVWVLPVTATRIVAGALATRDFQDVHHDRDLALAKGSKDIFFNINTTVGLVQRYVTDWCGPQVVIRAIRIRLGAPAYPHSHLSFSGAVGTLDPGTGRATLEIQATNELGAHASGTVEVELPR